MVFDKAGQKKRKYTIIISVIVLIFVLCAAAYFGMKYFNQNDEADGESQNEAPMNIEEETPEPPVKKINVQPELDAWLAQNEGTYSVVLRSMASGEIAARHNEDKPYFMASIYKLYVAYLALIDAQDGKHDLGENYLNNWTRQQCIDKMIRDSHSPCGEKYMAELGWDNIEIRLKKLGLNNTDFGAFTTSAGDADVILLRLHQNEDLNAKHADILLDAMKGQIYRDTIAKGVTDAVVANKVGFRGLVEYHDVAIIYSNDGEVFILSIFSQSAGTARLADLSKTLIMAADN